jgi:putative nucleotidyltransferase with HDIG domain
MPVKTRALFVDDDKSILGMSAVMLEKLGCSVKTAGGAEEALFLLSSEQFDIVFIDQFLGPERGIDLMKRLSAADSELYFVIVTGDPDTRLAVEALKGGASDFITKPFLDLDLLRSIEYVLKKKKLDRERKDILAELESRVEKKTDELQQIYFSVLTSLARAVEKKDLGTYGHSLRVSHYACRIAAALGLLEEDMKTLKTASLLHDIGKIGIGDSILGKRGPLSEDEMRVIRSHPEKGVEILAPLKQFESLLPAILHHHEHYDGSGYPQEISGNDIPLFARIISVADAYDAILSDRPYRAAADNEKAVRELASCSGKHFDPLVINAFLDAVRKQDDMTFLRQYEVAGTPGRTGPQRILPVLTRTGRGGMTPKQQNDRG